MSAVLSRFLSSVLLAAGFLTTGQSFAADPGSPPNPPSFYVVEIANFACEHCRNMDALLPDIQAATEKAGGAFDFAPVVWGDMPADRDYVYYAARVQGPAMAEQVRKALFVAVQDQGLSFDSVHQAVDWLASDLPAMPADTYTQLEQDASNPEIGQQAEARAEHLADTAGVSMTPTYVFVQAGKVVSVVGYDDSMSSQALEARVLSVISTLGPQPPASPGIKDRN